MDAVSIALSIILFAIILLYFRKNERDELIDRIPGPRRYPLIGNLLEELGPREHLIKRFADRRRKYGPIFRTWLSYLPAVHLISPELVEPILSSNKRTQKGVLYKFLWPWLGTGLLTSNGQKWFSHRKMITPTFHFKILDTFLEVFQENSEILVKRLKEKAETKEEFDIYSFITFAALDIICETAMGTKINAQSQTTSSYVSSIYRLSSLTITRGLRIWLHPDFMFNKSKTGKDYYENLKVVHGFTEKVIQERKQLRSNSNENISRENENDDGSKKRQAFLDLLLNESENSEAGKLNDVELREEVDTFMFEGHDTTTAGICWALYLLGHNPKIQDDVYEELQNIFSDDPGRKITMKDLNEMKLLERVIKETLRLYPSVPFISRYLEEDIQLGEYLVPKKTTAVIHIFYLHRDPNIYPAPEVFDPDRFLPENVQKRHPYAYVPFSAGPRNCIGQKFALMEEKVVLSTLLRNYKFESVEKREDLVLMSELILRPKSGIKLKISKRV